MKKWKNRNKGITLIALVITIIVILILAGVTIANLTGDNGLLQKTQTAQELNEEAEILEKIKLAYADYQTGQYGTVGYTYKNALEKIFGDGKINISQRGDKYIIKIDDLEDSYYYNNTTCKSGKNVDPFNYGTKTKQTIVSGEDVILGTEKFKVISNINGEIMAMPYYNLVLNANPIIQATAEIASIADSEGTSRFATEVYWTNGEQDINMNDPKIKFKNI